MKLAVFGTGSAGRTLAAKLAANNHSVYLGTRDPVASRQRRDKAGNLELADWLAANPGVTLATFADAAQHAEWIVNALNGDPALPGLHAAGANNLAGKIIIDVSNPLDFSNGFPPSLSVSNTDSLGETLQRTFPHARVVKALNTVNASVMVDPACVGYGDHTLFICGNDADAKLAVTAFLKSEFDWQDILDLGDMTNARGTEAYLLMWVRLYAALGSPNFSIKLVR